MEAKNTPKLNIDKSLDKLDLQIIQAMMEDAEVSYADLGKQFFVSGGTSTSGLINNFKLNKEIIRACKQNGIYTNLLILLLKIPAKIMGKIKAINYKF
jgi:hypothetical protein